MTTDERPLIAYTFDNGRVVTFAKAYVIRYETKVAWVGHVVPFLVTEDQQLLITDDLSCMILGARGP